MFINANGKLVNLIKIALHDVDNYNSETAVISVNPFFNTNELSYIYDFWDDFWNGGDSFESIAEFEETYDNYEEFIKIISDNFDAFVSIATQGWSCSTFIDIINYLYPDANAEIIDMDEFVFDY